jgi:hypothetical protein
VITAYAGAELQSDDPAALAARWSEAVDLPVATGAGGDPEIALDDAVLRFVQSTDGRGDGLGGLDLHVADRAHVLAAAEERGLKRSDDRVDVCGVRFRLV